MNRRGFLLTTAFVSTGAILALKPSDKGASYSPYFASLNTMLRTAGEAKPTLIVDLDLLDHNIEQLLDIVPRKAQYRIAVKSIPSPDLVRYVMEKTDTNKLMVFHQPFLNHVADSLEHADVLLGKPMPVMAAQRFYSELSEASKFDHEHQLQWLIDTPLRAKEYLALAKKRQVRMQINVEIDVGLHRGGITNHQDLDSILSLALENPDYLHFSGFMGYDPQVVKFPSIIKTVEEAYQESQTIYRGFVEHVKRNYPQIDTNRLCLNGAGSPTIPVHGEDTVLNDVTAGSCLVKPTQFDIPQLNRFLPAAFIATPVLKKLEGTHIPGLEGLSDVMGKWNPNRQQTFFIYGGKWKADYISPNGLLGNPIYGTSTNQMMVNCSKKANLNVDDFVFLRPEQSEFVFLQFGDLLMTRNTSIFQKWRIFQS